MQDEAEIISIEPVVDLLRSEVADLQVVYLFGSTASGNQGFDSDVDLAFLAGSKFKPSSYYDLLVKASSVFSQRLDLIELRTASTVLQYQVLESGRVIYESDPSLTARFEVTVLAMYCALNEERRDLIETIRQQGLIHA